MTDTALDPLADGQPNPFAADPTPAAASPALASPDDDSDALAPLTVTRGASPPAPSTTSTASGLSSRASAPSVGGAPAGNDPLADGQPNPFAGPPVGSETQAAPAGSVPGPLSNSDDDGWFSGFAKNVATTAIRGVSHIPGFVGDMRDFADAAMEVPEYIESKVTGQPFADVVAKRNALARQSRAASDADQSSVFGFSLDPRRYFPSGSQVAAPILAKTGAYQPTTALGRYASAAGEAALGGLGPGGGAIASGLARDVAPGLVTGLGNIARGAVEHAPANAAAGVSSQAASDATDGDPLAASLAGMAVPSVVGAARGYLADRPARQAAAVLSQGTADPQAALDAIRNRPEPIPGVNETTAQVTQDPGVYGLQTAAAGTDARGPLFAARQQQQGRGFADALDALKPGGDPQQVANFFSRHFDDIGDRTQAIIDGHLADAQAQADALRGQGLPVDAYGSALRSKIADTEAARNKAESAMHDAVDPEGRLTNDMSGIKQTAQQVYGAMPAADRMRMDPAEQGFADLIKGYGDVEPFREVQSLKSNLADAMREELRKNGSTRAFRRMTMLIQPVQDALNGTVARKAAADNAAVAAGTMAPEQTLVGRMRDVLGEYVSDQRNSRTASGEGAAATGTGDATGSPSAPGASSQGDQRPRISSGNQAVPRDVAGAAPQVGSVAPGATRPVYSPSGAIGVRNELAEHSDLITSHDADFRPNADFPQNLQPRARDSAAARDQVNGMAARLNPERLGPSPEANAGAPIVGPDNVVESGNGRTMALGKAYDAGGTQAAAYRQHLENLGYDTTAPS